MGLIGQITLLAAFAALTVVSAVRWPMLAVCLFLVLTLTNTPAILVHEHGLPSIGALLVPALAGLLILRRLLGREQTETALLLMPFLALLFLTTALRLPWVENPEATAFVADELLKNLVIVLVLVGFLTTLDRVHWATRAVVLAIGSLALLSVLQSATGRFDTNFMGYANAAYLHIQGDTQGWRLTGPLPDPNFFAQLLLTALPLTIALIFVEKRWPFRVLAAVIGVAILATIFLTYSRGALLALVAMALAAVLLSRSRAILLPALVIGGALVAVVGPVAAFDRVFSGLETARLLFGDTNISGDPAVIQRVSVMRAASRMFVENPLLGIGPGQFSSLYEDYALRYALDMNAPAAAHSLYLEIAAEQGLLGLIVFAAFVLTPIGLAGRALLQAQAVLPAGQTYLLRAVLLGIIGYLAAALFLHDAYPRFFWVFMALLFATWGSTTAAVAKHASLSRSSDMPESSHDTTASATFSRLGTLQTIALRTFGQRRVPILIGAVVLGGLSALQIAQTPAQYSTDAKLIYRFGREYFPITPTEVRRNWGENIIVSLDNALATELHLLSSHEVAAMALDALDDPEQILGNAAKGPGQTVVDQTSALAKMLDIRRIQGTTMLGVRLTHSDPAQAEQVLETFIDAYMRRRDMLFHADASVYFDSQQEALQAKDEAVQTELMRLRFERSELEAQADVTTWTPDMPRNQKPEDIAQITRQILWIDGLIEQQEKRSDVFRTRLLELERERQDWEMSRAYNKQVGPTVEVADRTPVSAINAFPRSVMQVVSAAIGGGLLVWLGAILLYLSKPENRAMASRASARKANDSANKRVFSRPKP